jgi:hypothetical protein
LSVRRNLSRAKRTSPAPYSATTSPSQHISFKPNCPSPYDEQQTTTPLRHASDCGSPRFLKTSPASLAAAGCEVERQIQLARREASAAALLAVA